MVGILMITKGVIKDKIVILHYFCNAIHFELAFMHSDDWIGSTDSVDFTGCFLFLEDRSFSYTDGNLHI